MIASHPGNTGSTRPTTPTATRPRPKARSRIRCHHVNRGAPSERTRGSSGFGERAMPVTATRNMAFRNQTNSQRASPTPSARHLGVQRRSGDSRRMLFGDGLPRCRCPAASSDASDAGRQSREARPSERSCPRDIAILWIWWSFGTIRRGPNRGSDATCGPGRSGGDHSREHRPELFLHEGRPLVGSAPRTRRLRTANAPRRVPAPNACGVGVHRMRPPSPRRPR